MADDWKTRFAAEREIEAKKMAQKYTLEEMAAMVADAAPAKRNAYAVEALIPWTLIMAIRYRMDGVR